MNKSIVTLVASTLLAAAIAPVSAATRTVTLSVPGMTCTACPITVKKALMKVEGVSNVDAAYQQLEAIVTFDDARTSVEALADASKSAGYPAWVKK